MERMIGWTSHRLTLTSGERRELLGLVKRGYKDGNAKVIEALLPTDENATYDVVPGAYVGRFALQSGRVLDIGSGLIVPSDDLLHVLRVAGHLPARLDDASTPSQEGWGIVDVLAFALATEAEGIIARGLAKAYEQRRFRSPPLPGSIDVRDHLSRHGARPDKLVTVAHRLTVDIPRNQAIAAATSLLLRLPLQPAARVRLRRVAAALSTVSTPPMSPSAIDRMIGEHRQARYDAALRLCALVLRGNTLSPAGATLSGASVLFAMTDVWQDFVLAWVRQSYPGAVVKPQYSFPLLNGRSTPAAAADVVVLDSDEQPSVLFDAKYKAASATPSADDIYQMVTYCERLRLPSATLVHPGSGETTSVGIGDRTIVTVRLAVDQVAHSGSAR
ncbi:5-methylcytosine restriction system specificity protein McrC [Jatrophihabitans lederbergiae]|uniref:Restriction endonuclease n=1 Tax=Jatrophihabitans lederbergiae TaxID=3075547 RepID=A0ABU2JBA5_9ACTN|nr:hypothetical protein [Jatrophihabitans sp. DSM 44399]MDT0262276.1 hypothetical protein [Jatrophihabitans sp. DSM 44399]